MPQLLSEGPVFVDRALLLHGMRDAFHDEDCSKQGSQSRYTICMVMRPGHGRKYEVSTKTMWIVRFASLLVILAQIQCMKEAIQADKRVDFQR